MPQIRTLELNSLEKNMEFLKGKSPRSTMWYVFISITIGAALIVTLLDMGASIAVNDALLGIYVIVANIITVIFGIRRLHDMGKSGWWILLALVPLLNIALTLALLFRPGISNVNNNRP